MKAAAHGIPPPACQNRHNYNRSHNGAGCGVKSCVTPKPQKSKMVMTPLLRLDSVGEGASFETPVQSVRQLKMNTVSVQGTPHSKLGIRPRFRRTPEPNSLFGKLCHFVSHPTLTSKHLAPAVPKTHSGCALDELLNSRNHDAVRPTGSKSGVQQTVKMAQNIGLGLAQFNRYGQWGVMCPSYPLLPKGVFPCHVFRAIQSQSHVFLPQPVSCQQTHVKLNGSRSNLLSGFFESEGLASVAANYLCDRSGAYPKNRSDFSKDTQQGAGFIAVTETFDCRPNHKPHTGRPKTVSNNKMESKRANRTRTSTNGNGHNSSPHLIGVNEDRPTNKMINGEKRLACEEQNSEILDEETHATCVSLQGKGDKSDYDGCSNVMVATREPEVDEQPSLVTLGCNDEINADWLDCETESVENDNKDESQCSGVENEGCFAFEIEFKPLCLESFFSKPAGLKNSKGSPMLRSQSNKQFPDRISRELQEARRRWDKHYSSVNCQELRPLKVSFKCGPDEDQVFERNEDEGEVMTAMELQKIRELSQNSCKDEESEDMSHNQSITESNFIPFGTVAVLELTTSTDNGKFGDQVNAKDASGNVDVDVSGVDEKQDGATSANSTRRCASFSTKITCFDNAIYLNHHSASVGKEATASKDRFVCEVDVFTAVDDPACFLEGHLLSVTDSDSDEEEDENASETDDDEDIDDDDVIFADEEGKQ